MEPGLTFKWDTSQIGPFRSQGLERALFRALSKSGGDAIRAARTASSRTVRFRKAYQASAVNRGLVLGFPNGKREIADLEWRVRVSGDAVPASAFPYRVIKRRTSGRRGRRQFVPGGVKVQINRGRWSMIESAFVARMQSNHVGIFRRRGDARLPIDEVFTTRISDVFTDNGMIPAVHDRAQVVFAASFARLLPLEVAKAGR